MRRRYYIIFFFSILVFSNKAIAQEWIPIDGKSSSETVTKRILSDNASCYQVDITVNGLHDQLVTNEKGTFHYLSLGNGKNLLPPGDPSFPFIPLLIAIPSGMTALPSISDEVWEEIDMPAIYPAQKLLREGEAPKEFLVNEHSYTQDYLPSLITTGEQMEWRGIVNMPVAICPFRYYPQNSKLSVLKHFVLKVDFLPNDVGSSREQDQYENHGHYGLFDNSVFAAKRSQELNSRSENYELLILVNNPSIYNSDKLKEFRRWKALKGIKTKVIPIQSSWGYPEGIKNKIQDEYESGARYVLLVGDDGSIAPQFVTSLFDSHEVIYSDYWYGCLGGDNDYEGDIPIGRFPTGQLSEFENMVDKTIRYEMGKNLSNKVLLVANKDGASYPDSYQACCDTILSHHSGRASFYTAYGAPVAYGGDNASNADVVDYINQGMHLVNYRGHGGNDFWGGSGWGDSIWNAQNEIFRATEINNMNSNTNAVFFSVCCYTGNIMADSCMLDTFMRSPKGAAAFVGSSMNSDTGANSVYNIYLFEKIYDEDICRIGDANIKAHISTIPVYWPNTPSYKSRAKDHAFSYICGGDPTLEIWRSDPMPVPNVDISSAGSSITVSTGINDGYFVCLSTVDGDFIDSTWVSGSTHTFTKPSDEFYFSIYKRDYIPYVVYCNSETHFLQNVTIADNRFYDNSPFAVGEDVDPSGTIGDVSLSSGAAVFIQKGSGGVLLDAGFKCNKGAQLIIK